MTAMEAAPQLKVIGLDGDHRILADFATQKVIKISFEDLQHAELKEMLDVMWKRRRKYGYNYIGLCLAYFHIVW